MFGYISSASKCAAFTDFIFQYWWGMSSEDLDELYLQGKYW